MTSPNPPPPPPSGLNRIPNGFLVFLTVALLLQGPVGAFEALWSYSYELVRAIFGGEELLLQVLCQTAPMTFAVGAIVFSFRSGWITFSSPGSLFAAALLVLAGTWGGGELRSAMASISSKSDAGTQVASKQTQVLPVSTRGETHTWLSKESLPDLGELHKNLTTTEEEPSDTISIEEAYRIFSDFETVATDGTHHRWDQSVPRVALIPEANSLWGLAARAINQLLGYFVVYRPRLFLASILVGTYIGWSWQPYFEGVRFWIRAGKDPEPANR